MRTSTSEKIASFVEGYGLRGDKEASPEQTIMNGIYIASRLMRFKLPFKFETRGVIGVECWEIRRLLIDHITRTSSLANAKPSNLRILYVGRLILDVEPEKLGWIAQYLYSKRKHLYKHEADFALRTLKRLRQILDLQISLETAVLLI